MDLVEAFKTEKLFHSVRTLNNTLDYEIVLINHIFESPKMELQKYLDGLFTEDLHIVDFKKDPDISRLFINRWISHKTNGNINNLVPISLINSDTFFLMVRKLNEFVFFHKTLFIC